MRSFVCYILFFILSLAAIDCRAQERVAENRPYCDLRPLHLGVIVGTHWQDTEFHNLGPQTLTDADGNSYLATVTCEQDTWDMGFHVGVLGELRLNANFALRIAPTIYFGNRHIKFRNLMQQDEFGGVKYEQQDMKSAFIGCDLDIIFAAKRFNNHRPYFMAGLVPMLNLTTKENDYIQMKKGSIFAEVGMGCDFYLPFFKLRPELKYMFSLSNTLNASHADDLRDPAMIPYAKSVDKAASHMIALTFYFE